MQIYPTILAITLISSLSIATLSADTNKPKENILNITVPKAPEVPNVPKVQAVVPKVNLIYEGKTATPVKLEKTVVQEQNNSHFSFLKGDRFPPDYYKKKEVVVEEKVAVGEVQNARIAAYVQTGLLSQEEVLAKLEAAGFQVLTQYKVDKKGKVTSIVFSDAKMIANASKKGRGFAASLRLLIDEKNAQISISNPIYVFKAYMQDDYDDAYAKATLKRLRDNFEGLRNSKDVVKFIRLPRYKFMNSMPVYEDMVVVTEGKNEQLLAKAHASKKVVFEQKLDNGATLLGIKLSKRTSKFVKKTGYQNAELLPYPLLIEDGKAKILDPKYYIAVMYPLLSMSEFMTIATVPGAISKDADRIFR